MKPEELFRYEEMYASMREALGTSWLVFEIGPGALGEGLAPDDLVVPRSAPTGGCLEEDREP